VTKQRNAELGNFLRSRRARMDPSQAGLEASGHRRVPGLRREELARLAGVSPDYYARLEQGRQSTASVAVLDSIAGALRLTPDERSHVYTLARVKVPEAVEKETSANGVDERIRRVLDRLGDTPAIVYGLYVDIIFANAAACFVFTDFNAMPADERNAVTWMLLSPQARELYGESWEESAGDMVGLLRMDAGRRPDAPRLQRIVGDLTRRSPLFRQLWDTYQVSTWEREKKTLHHESGELEFHSEFIRMESAPGQVLCVMIPSQQEEFEARFRQHDGGTPQGTGGTHGGPGRRLPPA
jgi:transcriptional regulator with XRE-family HTH domain